MFCENCGTKNENDAKFCESCGAPLNFEETPAPVKEELVAPAETTPVTFTAKESKPMSKKSKLIWTIVGAVAILSCLFYWVGKSASDPEKVVTKYIDSISNENYAKAYECMSIEGSEFTTKDMFIKIMEERTKTSSEKILNYTVREYPSTTPLMKTYTVSYTQPGNSYVDTMDVTLIKQPSKKWLFFDDYRIAESDLIVKDYYVTVPVGTEVYIDEIKVEDKYLVKYEDTDYAPTTTSYSIPYIFTGMHKVKVTSPITEAKEFDKFVEPGTAIDIYSLKLTEEAKADACKIAEEFTEKVITSGIAKKSFDELSSYFSERADKEDMADTYENLTDRGIDEDGTGVKSVTLSNMESRGYEDYEMGASYSVSVDYEYTYTSLREDYWDDTIEEYSPSSPEEGSATVYFVYENGKWMITDYYVSLYMYY